MTHYVKPKFHYADFTVFTETSLWGKSRTQIKKFRDTNHVNDFCDLCPVVDFVIDFSRVL